MYRFFICYLLLQFLFASTSLTAQNFTDSLLQKNYKELAQQFFKLRKTDSTKAKKIADFYIKKAKNNTDTLKIVKGLYLYKYISNYEEEHKYMDSIIMYTKSKQNKEYPALAYFAKAQLFLYEKRDIKKTINNLNEARKHAILNKNIDLVNRVDYHIATIKSEHLNDKEKALEIFKKCEKYYSNGTKYNHKVNYLYTLHIIAETYLGIKKYDSTTYYNTVGYYKASISADSNLIPMKSYFVLCEGINQYAKRKYQTAIDSINKALPTMIEFKDKAKTIDAYFYLGKSYYDLDNKEKAISYFKKTDSILETLKSIPQYTHIKTYEYLKNYYKNVNDLQNQNKYLNKLNTVLNEYLNDQIFISKKVKEDYDIPLLLEEQDVLIQKLNKSNSTYVSSILILIILLLSSGGLLYYQYRKKRLYRLRFEKLMEAHTVVSESVHIDKKTEIVAANKTIQVPEKHITHILGKLDEFEKELKYLTLGISAQSLSDDINTNVKYLSRVINHYKNKTFTTYLNELRIAHAVKELKTNITLQKYTIKAIANEMGYNSAETFSNAFYKQVKIKPSYFIKELRKAENNKQ
ncbi:helix-turn-helix domain-containing protein [Aquimarina macrocephali]|uniref:helix-turn-helix domain-containing protein n=1 Tax=Aquimarina macrocephali TaxID=666563 RepID=UPI0004BAC849|nr:helix-turn-helix domain-containing protein [Aquimarina macrocephali]